MNVHSPTVHNPNVTLRAALYLRVSTTRQAEHDVSIPDQKRQGEAYCEARGYQLVETFVEPGNSATNDRRPEFQRMIEAATAKPASFDVVVVHSFSRFFRDEFEMEFYYRKLAKNGVKLVSITQELGDDPIHDMMRRIMSLFDEYQSKENAKHVLRALKENARQGFWNGSLPPIGYRVVAAEQRGAKVKKKLEIDPLHAETIRLIYRLALEGEGSSGQMGVKAIVKYLNGKGIFTRDGGRWGIGQVHRILTRRTYIGEHRFNRRSNKGEVKPEDEVITVQVPALIERETFDAVQKLLQARNPKTELPARVVIGPTLLTGICYCGNCGGAMTIRTGKGGRYRYYACSIKARQGETGCKGRAIPMDKLDRMVVGHIEERLLDADRLEDLLGTVLGRRDDQAERRRHHIAELERRATESELRLKRLYDAIEAGVADLDDPALKERIAGLKVIRDQARADADRAQALLDSPGHSAITPTMIRGFARRARERIRGSEGGYRRDHLRSLAQRVEVADDAIRIMGSKTELLRTLIAGQVRQSAVAGVPRGVPKWRTVRDSNPRDGSPPTHFPGVRLRPLGQPSVRAGLSRRIGRRKRSEPGNPLLQLGQLLADFVHVLLALAGAAGVGGIIVLGLGAARAGSAPTGGHGLQEQPLLALKRLEPRHRGHRVRKGRQVLHHLGLALAQHLEAGGQELRHDGLGLGRITAHQVGQHVDGQDILAPPLVLGDDLQQILPGQVVAAFQIDDLDLPPRADEAGNILKRDVIAGLGVVEPPAGITLDQKRGLGVGLGHGSSGDAFAA